MNELLQKHGCANVFTVPEGLRELMSDITREVLRAQPGKIYDFIANYLSVLIITREHGVMAVKILDDLCDCRPSVTEHLEAAGMVAVQASTVAAIIQEEIEKAQPEEGDENVKEAHILKKILQRYPFDEDMTAKVCQIARNAYRDYWYRKELMAQTLAQRPEEPWEIAAAHTLEIYKRTNPTFSELHRATQKIQAAYRGYHTRRSAVLIHKEKPGAKKKLPGPPLDIGGSREIDLGRVISLKVGQDDVSEMFEVDVRNKLGLPYDTTRMLTLVSDDDKAECTCDPINLSAFRRPPRTPHSSAMTHASMYQAPPSPPRTGSLIPRISFAPTAPVILGIPSPQGRDEAKVAEEPDLTLGRDSDAEEVAEDIDAHTDGEESAVSDVTSGTVPEALDATEEDIGEGEEEEEEE